MKMVYHFCGNGTPFRRMALSSDNNSPSLPYREVKESQTRSFTRRALLTAAAAGSLVACGPATITKKDADVIIVGAGLSGLFAAMWLTEQGYKVIVLEASNRIGGRLWTLDNVNGRPEAGGSQVGQTYARIRYAAEKLGLKITTPPPQARSDRLIALGDQRVLQSQWEEANENPFPNAFRALPPDRALFAASARQNPFDWPGAWREASLDIDQSAGSYLSALGFNEPSRQLVNIALNANDLDTYSMINVWRSLQLFAEDAALGPSGAIEGGSQRLPEAMAASLGDAVKPGFAVQSVDQDGDRVAVSSERETLRADYCILALPFPAIQKLNLTPVLPPLQTDAIEGLPYTQILQLHLEPETPFWDTDGLPIDMWTDGPLERVFPTRNESGELVGLLAWINGTPASGLASLDDEALAQLARQEMERIRPASQGKLSLAKAVRWTKDQSYAGGAYMHWAPGQAASWAGVMGAPHGRIHFAGEHLSHLHTGMEGAMESGQNAAEAIIRASQ